MPSLRSLSVRSRERTESRARRIAERTPKREVLLVSMDLARLDIDGGRRDENEETVWGSFPMRRMEHKSGIESDPIIVEFLPLVLLS